MLTALLQFNRFAVATKRLGLLSLQQVWELFF